MLTQCVLPAVTVAEFIQAIADLENKADGVADAMGITALSNGVEVANLVSPVWMRWQCS